MNAQRWKTCLLPAFTVANLWGLAGMMACSGTVWSADPVPYNWEPLDHFCDRNHETGAAVAEYDPHTGELRVTARDVINWYVESSSSGLNGFYFYGDVPYPRYVLTTDNRRRFGKTSVSNRFSDCIHSSTTDGLRPGDLTLYWNADLGLPLQTAPVRYVPEPVSVIWLLAPIVAKKLGPATIRGMSPCSGNRNPTR